MTKEEHIEYWVKSAEHDFEAASDLFDIKRYDWCLFIGHLVLEKMLKAHYVIEIDKVPPKIHDLVRLAAYSGIEISENYLNFLEKANYFQLSTRYPDEKLKFYKMCNKEYTEIQFSIIKEIFLWLKSKLKY